MSNVPGVLRARRRDLPALAWVVSMAYCPYRSKWLRRPLGLLAWPAWLIMLTIAFSMGSPCAIGSHAVLIAQERQESAVVRVRRILLAVPIAAAAATVLLVVPALALTELVWWLAGWESTSAGYSRVILSGTMVPILAAVLGVRVARSGGLALRPVVDELANLEPAQPVWLLSLLAAWPKGQGHGRRLLRAVLDPEGLPGAVVFVARDDRLVETYQRYGMQGPHRGRVMSRPPAQGRTTTPLPPSAGDIGSTADS